MGRKLLFIVLVITVVTLVYLLGQYKSDATLEVESVSQTEETEIKSIHAESGLIEDEGLQMVLIHCTGCHSPKLIAQNRSTKEGWLSMIRWMQANQGLWPLGESEEIILNYLADNYAPQKKGRRDNLSEIEWYQLLQ